MNKPNTLIEEIQELVRIGILPESSLVELSEDAKSERTNWATITKPEMEKDPEFKRFMLQQTQSSKKFEKHYVAQAAKDSKEHERTAKAAAKAVEKKKPKQLSLGAREALERCQPRLDESNPDPHTNPWSSFAKGNDRKLTPDYKNASPKGRSKVKGKIAKFKANRVSPYEPHDGENAKKPKHEKDHGNKK